MSERLSEMEKSALLVIRDYGEMTMETSKKLGLDFFTRRLETLGMIHSYHLISDESYDEKDQFRLGFHGGVWKSGDREKAIRHTARTIKITIKGHAAIRTG